MWAFIQWRKARIIFKVNNVNLYYELRGKDNAETIILIAGFSCDHTFWTAILDQLSAEYKVLVFDNRGVGRSSHPNQAYSIQDMSNDVMALVHKLGLKNPIIAGQSMGSAIAQDIGRRYANEIKKIVLINTFVRMGKGPEVAFSLTGELQRLNVALSYRVQSIVGWVYSNTFLSQPNQLANLIKIAENNLYPQSLSDYEQQLNALKQFNSSTWLQEIKTPALIIAAEEDLIAPLAGAKEVHDGIGHQTQMLIVPGGHASPIEQPSKVTQAILNFVE